ncbi:MAG: 6-phosphofructokinase [Clostridia bacterium]|nr:6-phosphofructokinase [Clostridia bacterium]MBR7100143.1 6-phosphofructokinase [Clostridia bacterium]
MKRIGILTSGGDAPGMNAAIRAIVRTGIYFGMEVYGIERGYAGLINDEVVPMNMRSVSDIVQRGGTKLRTARCLEMLTKEGQQKAVKTLKNRGIEGLVVIGGDGSFRGAKVLSEEYGIPTIGIPGTIDNDLAYTDYTLGFDTAVNTCLDIINKLRDTMTSHERISVVEVMGRHCGDIALYAGIGSGAEIIVVPEVPYDMDDIIMRINRSRANEKHSNIIVIAEGVMSADSFAKQLQEVTTYSVRPTNIGHVQRGGSPSMQDRMLAAQFGNKAVRLLKDGIGNRVIGIRDNKIIDMDIIEAVSMKKEFNYELYNTLQMISM